MEKENLNKKNKNKVVKVLIIILVCLLVFILTVASSFYIFINIKLSKINYIDLKSQDIAINQGVKEQLDSYRNIAILGLDTRNDSYDGCRSDGIIIVSINEQTKEVKITSVYRDTYLDISEKDSPDSYLDKVTHAYAYGGPGRTLSALNRNLDLNITEFVAINFSAVVDIVDAVGGIYIDIQSDEIQYINGYIATLEGNVGRKTSRITSSGLQHLDGIQATAYCRIRATEGGDYKRTERMRTVLSATFEKAKQFNIGELNHFADIVLPHLSTNIKKEEIYQTIPNILKYHIVNNTGWPYNINGKTINGVWYGVPTSLEKDVSKLHDNLFGTKNYNPSETVKQISNEINSKFE